ncbi:MAG: hypothetical protein RL238_1796 [Actinomycetota bacterium]|jgi:hypothetical protein
MRKRAGFLITLAGALLVTFVSGVARADSPSAPVTVEIVVVDGNGSAVDPLAEVHPAGPEGALACQLLDAGHWMCSGGTFGTYQLGDTFGPIPDAMFDAQCATSPDGTSVDPAAMVLGVDGAPTAAVCTVTYSRASSGWPGDNEVFGTDTTLVESEGPVPTTPSAPASLPATGSLEGLWMRLGIIALLFGAGLSALTRRPVR